MSKKTSLLNTYGFRGFGEEYLHFHQLITVGVIQRDPIHTALSHAGV